MAETALVKASERRDAIERRRLHIAKFGCLAGDHTPTEIRDELLRLVPPIVASVRTIERDRAAIKANARKYIAQDFDGAFEVSAAAARYELLARTATRRALEGNADATRWARIAIRATEARTSLFADIGLIDRTIGTLFIDDGQRADRIPSGVELAAMFRDVSVTEDELISPAERAFREGDWQAAADGPDRRD